MTETNRPPVRAACFFERPYALLSPPSLHIARSSRSAHNKTTHNKIAHNKIAHNKTARRHPPQAVHLISAQVFPLLWHRITLSEYRPEVKLLQFNLSTGSFQLSLDFFGFSLRSAFLNSLRSTVNQVFGFFLTQRGNAGDLLNNVIFVSAGFIEDNVEFGLFFSCGSSTAGSRSSNGSSRRNAPLFFQHFR